MASFITANETLTVRQNGCMSREGGEVIGRMLDEATGVGAGLFVAPSGTIGLECQEPNTAALAQKALGVTLFTPFEEDGDLTDGEPHYNDNAMVSILRKGAIYVNAEGTVVAENPVYVRITSDGGSNTTLGKVRGDSDVVSGGIVITPDASFTAALTTVGLTLSDGTNTQSFQFSTDASPTTAEVAAGLVAAIDASTLFAATGTVDINVTSTTGIVELVAADERLTLTVAARAIRVPGWFFAESRTGAGLVEIRGRSDER